MDHDHAQDLTTVSEIAKNFLHKDVFFDTKLLGEGDCNVNYLVENVTQKIVVKLSRPYREYKALEEYKKEKWCTAKALELGIPTPAVLDVGQHNGRAYQIQTYVKGTPGAKLDDSSSLSKETKLFIWKRLGEYTKKINSIPVTGWGEHLVDVAGTFADSWGKHVWYNIDSLNDEDELLSMNILNQKSSSQLKQIFQSLMDRKFSFGLCHNDIALRNTMLTSQNEVYLLDWGTALADIVPHCDLNEILSASKPDEQTLQAFLDGYGMSLEQFNKLKPELEGLRLLSVIDKLRWALDKKPENFEDYVARAREAVAALGKPSK